MSFLGIWDPLICLRSSHDCKYLFMEVTNCNSFREAVFGRWSIATFRIAIVTFFMFRQMFFFFNRFFKLWFGFGSTDSLSISNQSTIENVFVFFRCEGGRRHIHRCLVNLVIHQTTFFSVRNSVRVHLRDQLCTLRPVWDMFFTVCCTTVCCPIAAMVGWEA